MFREMGRLDEDAFSAFVMTAAEYLCQALSEGSYRGWIAEESMGNVTGGAGVLLRPMLPRPDCLMGPEAIVLNVYVEPVNRRRGIARRLVGAILDWCTVQQVRRIVLHPSSAGKNLYESMGFVPTGELIFRGTARA
jgi:GNAT superfamily N-acetyltransferase